MESVFDMLRPLYFMLLFAAVAFLAFTIGENEEKPKVNAPSEVEGPPNLPYNDLETDASAWGYRRPLRYYGDWGYGRGYFGGWRGYYGGWGGRGWGGRGYGGWGYWR